MKILIMLLAMIIMFGCQQSSSDMSNKLSPVVVTEQVKHDADDPAIWIHPTDPTRSLIIGTDKKEDGALYVFGMDGKIDEQKKQ